MYRASSACRPWLKGSRPVKLNTFGQMVSAVRLGEVVLMAKSDRTDLNNTSTTSRNSILNSHSES